MVHRHAATAASASGGISHNTTTHNIPQANNYMRTSLNKTNNLQRCLNGSGIPPQSLQAKDWKCFPGRQETNSSTSPQFYLIQELSSNCNYYLVVRRAFKLHLLPGEVPKQALKLCEEGTAL